LSVNQVTLNPNADVSLPPFADALRALKKERRRHYQSAAGPLRGQDHQDLAQARRLVLDRYPEYGGLPRLQPQDAQHDGMVDVPGAYFGEGDRSFRRS
jgi:hypothetical protein